MIHMLKSEWCQACTACDTVTPHSRSRVAPSAILLVSLLILGAVFSLGRSIERSLEIAGLIIGLLVIVSSRARGRRISCERCRARHVQESRRAKPTLDGNTEISLF
jgi:hypothetical protein